MGSGGSGGTITISNGTVTATGDINGGAGIGGGLYASGGIIIINSGTVTATGGGGAGIGGGGDSIGNSYTSVSIAVAATVQAFAQSKDTPAIDSFYGNTGTGHYVIGCLDARNYACILVYYADGSTERTGSLILPADYASFAYTTGTDTVRTDRIFAYQTLGNAYLGRAERVYDSSPDITSTKNAAPVELRLNSDAALVPPDYGNLKIPVTQHEGSGREDTAARASVKAYPDPTQVDNVILAYSYDFPDALAASYLAGVLGAPILLCDTSEVPATTAAELNRLNPSAIYIVGGTGVISSEVENSLRSSGSVSSVTRLGGQGREETAYLIANAAKNLGGVPTSAFVAHSGNFPDALSAGSLSAGQGVPILLTPTGTLDAWAQRFLDENGVRDIIIVGGTGSVSEAAEDQLRALPSAPAVTRWSGTGRYETAEAVLKSAITKWNITPTVIGLASGEDFPDALVGGAAVGNRGGLLAITEPDALSAAATGIISTYKGTISDVEIFGGTGTIRVKTQAQELLS
ncbi:MAG: cell wall-binding repeat-containing protein [Coriobacteriales bacterium]|nr:cell wall-binding repeat-containing protein [Coriobacteriales bacterium]